MSDFADKIAILLASYNGEKFISEQVDSVLAQTYPNIKLFIHDDGSSDNTCQIVESYARRYPEKIVIVSDGVKCGGAVRNFTHLLKNVYGQADYYMFCDQDDVWLPQKVSATLDKMKQSEMDFGEIPILVHTDLKVVDAKLNVLSDSMMKYQKIQISNNKSILKLSLENTVTGCTAMLNKLLAAELTDLPDEAIVHDWWAALKALSLGGCVVCLCQPTMLYRQHGYNSIGTQKTDVKYMFSRLSKVKDVYFKMKAAVRQQRKCGLNVPMPINIIMKAYLITRRLFSK